MDTSKTNPQGHAKNLGQISAISFGATPPENTKLLWYDMTGEGGYLKAFNPATGKWDPVTSRSSIVGIEKIYTSIQEMEADKNPVSDITGQPLVGGQLAIIIPQDPQDPDTGKIFRWDAPGWSYLLTLGQTNMYDRVFDGGRADTVYGGCRIIDCGGA